MRKALAHGSDKEMSLARAKAYWTTHLHGYYIHSPQTSRFYWMRHLM